MATKTFETDYLVVGCGAAGMAFADSLLTDCDADIIMVDRRHAPGGHWNDAYPFVRLHQPSAYYGVNSLPLGSETIDTHGSNKGFYSARAPPRSAHTTTASCSGSCSLQDGFVTSRCASTSGETGLPCARPMTGRGQGAQEARRRHLSKPSIPATFKPPFEVATGARCIPVNDLPRAAQSADAYVIIGGGKTAADACLWLLEIGVAPDDIRWIRPRESWYLNRVFTQGGELVGTLFEGLSLQMEAAAQASSVDELLRRLNATAQLPESTKVSAHHVQVCHGKRTGARATPADP